MSSRETGSATGSPIGAAGLGAETLRLRPLERSDAPVIAGFCADLDVSRMTSRMPHPYTLADAESFLAFLESEEADETALAVEVDGRLAGVAGWMNRAGAGAAEIGYWLGRPFWGRGVATEAAARILALAFAEPGVEAMMAKAFQDNPASARVLEKLGFQRTGAAEMNSRARGGVAPGWTFELRRADWEMRR